MSKKTTIIIIVIVLLLCSCITVSGAVGGYFYYKSKSEDKSATEDTDDEKDTDEDEDDEDESEDEDKDDNDDQDEDNDEEDDDEDDYTTDLTYYNSYYGFSLTLEPGWEDYDVNEVSGSDYAGFVNYYDFSLPSTSEGGYVTLFTILVYTDEQWAGVLASGALDFTGEEKVGESGGYVFTFSHINGTPPSDLNDRMLDLENIQNSFKLD